MTKKNIKDKRPLIQLDGKSFGKWTVLAEVEDSFPRKWLCKCCCGIEKAVSQNSLTHNKSSSCGCGFFRDKWLGKRYGRLVVIKYYSGASKNGARVDCQCDCGKIKNVLAGNLARGNIQSCGCYRSEAMRLNGQKNGKKRYKGCGDLSGKYYNKIKRRCGQIREFNVSIEYLWKLFLSQDKKCKLSGLTISLDPIYSSGNQTASLDRIEPSIGYIEGNVQWVHKNVNWIKQDFNDTEFLEYIKIIYKHNFPNE